MSKPESGGAAWALTAHALGGALMGLLETARLDSGRVGLVLVPLFAATGLVVGALIAGLGRLVRGRPAALAALVLAAPSLAVTIPIARTLFDGPYARTLPLAPALPFAAPVLAWLLIAGVTWVGARLAAGDPISRAIAILAVAGTIGGIVHAERAVLGTGYPGAQIGAALGVIVLAGVFVRIAIRPRLSPYAAAAAAALALGTTAASLTDGLGDAADRRLLANRGDHGRDVVRLWRGMLDLDRDGSSALLGGGDCDDRDPARHPGARDVPGDGLDQDCDGADAVAAPVPPPPELDLEGYRRSPAYGALIERTRGMNVLVVSVDALRFDVVAPGAPHREDFPRITRLLDESVRFERVITPASATDISVCTMVTGRLDPFQDIAVTLPEAMRALGRHTSSVLPRELTRHVGEVLLDRGIDRPRRILTDGRREDVGDRVSAGVTTDEGLRGIEDAAGRPWYAWVHYFDIHEHHQIQVPPELMREVHPGATPKAHRYRALLRAIDRAVGRLLDELAARGAADRTIVWFVSDHGEALENDPRMPETHGNVAYTPLVRVPLAVRIPGVPAGVRTDPVTLVDLAPTMVALAGAPQAMSPLDGFELVPAILDGPGALRPPASRALVVHEVDQWSVIEWPYQVIVRPADDLVELYDVERDPLNRQDLSSRMPDLARRLRARYAEAPQVRVDRTWEGRAWRELRARRPPPRVPP
jgi:arylsulfatase A-like enzyme